MAYMQDDSLSFTINLTALLEGIGVINYIEVANMTQLISAEWFGGIWQTPLPQAVEADSIIVVVELLNDGATTDTLFGGFVSAQVTPAEFLIQEIPNVAVGITSYVEWSFTMPATNVSVTINAGHVE